MEHAMKRQVALLGATGSIGKSTLDVIARHPQRYSVFALTAANRMQELAALAVQHRPTVLVVPDARRRDQLLQHLPTPVQPEILLGKEGLDAVARHPAADTVVAAIVGAVGLSSTLVAAQHGKRILLANKEALVMGGPLVKAAAKASGATLLPVDSEHNALFQCMPPAAVAAAGQDHGIERLWLTASGGPFRTRPPESLYSVTPDEACAHPNWVMGRKISVDSATMMNKGLEVIEARWLFDCPPQRIAVVIHPQSVVHSMVQYVDGSFLAQLGSPDMRTPIAHALAYPERIDAGVQTLNPLELKALQFEAPDVARFPCLKLAYDALAQGHAACIVLNAANEVAVDAFLKGNLAFPAIAQVVEHCLNSRYSNAAHTLEDMSGLDDWARHTATAQAKHMRACAA
jgi:1-deoxy-D-xylulose-5-phosphate reductoisomerase